ncbi:MAG TPA: hypothetical protein VGG54_34700 [Trebonia sp.]
MGNSARRRGARLRGLTVTAACVTAALVLGGCASGSATGTPDATAATQAPAQASAQGSTRQPAACNADYCDPADWDTARATTPLSQIPPFAEPLNVVISARSTVSLADIQQALGQWKTVSTATTVNVTGIHLKCISSEQADVAGGGYVPQNVAWRLDGCVDGNDLSLAGNEDHVRIWNQPVPGSRYGAWFIAASYETLCLVKNGVLQTASTDKLYAALHPSAAYHCVDGGPGSIHTAHPDGYNDAGADFAAAVVAAARSRGWDVSQRTVAVPRGASAGEGGVPFGPTADVLAVTR